MTDRHPLVVALDEVGRDDGDLAGGKGANLGELLRAGVRVPPGFVVTTSACPAAAALVGEDETMDPYTRRASLESVAIPARVESALRGGYRALGGGAVAVRSSATAEDLPGAAFAGQQDTFLNVVGEDALLDAVRRCWASLWTDRAVAYRDRRGIDSSRVQIAVVVQRMVDAEVAGVLFTADPVTGAREQTVIDASVGLGEAVVSGSVTPDHVVLDARGRVLRQRAGTPDPAEPALAVLGQAGLRELAATGARIAAHFGRPQDIEWAYAGGTVWILQARPMTALPPAPLQVGRLRRIEGSVLAELLPVRPYPLDMTTWTVRGHGRILTRMMAEIPAVRVDLGRMLPEEDGVVQQLVPPIPRPTLRTLTTPLRMRRRIARCHSRNWTADPRLAAFEREIAELRAVDPPTASWTELLALPERTFAVLDRFIDLRIDYLPGVGVSLVRLRLLLAVLGLDRAFGAAMVGTRTRTTDANRGLRELAELVRGNPTWRAAFATQPDDELAQTVAHDKGFAEFREALRRYIDEFGHRETTSAFLMSAPTWGEDPRIVLGAIRALVEHPGALDDAADASGAFEEDLLRKRRVRLTRSGPRLAAAVQAVRSGIAFREDTHFHAMRLMPFVRMPLLEAGERLAAAGVLADAHDVLHLRLDELTGIADPGAVPAQRAADLRGLVLDRAARRAELAGAPLISPATLYRTPARSNALVAGAAASGGRATGPVRIVLDPQQFGLLRPGEILVCPYTNPSWTPLFEIAAAAVVDTGGVASHAAITAREYRIPAVMGTGNGTSTLHDGQLVEVDGDSGQVVAAVGEE